MAEAKEQTILLPFQKYLGTDLVPTMAEADRNRPFN